LDTLFPTSDLEEGFLKCGVALDSYEEDAANGRVTVHLNDNSSIVGCALLGCDGIHSKVRKCIHSEVEDPLNFCKCVAYWAKSPIPKASELEKELNRTQNGSEDGASFVLGFGSAKHPGSFFGIPTNGNLIWGLFFPAEDPPTGTDDLTRRGGGILTERGKQALLQTFEDGGYSSFLKSMLRQTKASDITEAGIFDRKNLDLAYSSDGKLVAILGDAAHPQSPFLGQGVNMAIADGYVLATRIAMGRKAGDAQAVANSISAYDTSDRRNSAKEIVETSRSWTSASLSSSFFMNWMIRLVIRIVPIEWMLNDVAKYDKSNAKLVQKLDEGHPKLNSSKVVSQ